MIKNVILVCGLFFLLTSTAFPQSNSRTYTIVAGESSLWVFVGKSGLLSGLAHDHTIGVKSFTGSVVVPEAGAGGGSLELEIDAKSLEVLDRKVSDEDRAKIFDAMHKDVLESAKYQKIIFKSISVSDLKQTDNNGYSFTLNGDLTLHGVTKKIAAPVTATITPQTLRVVGKYILKQTDYGITPYSAAGGTIKVKNEIVVNFIIVARA